MEITKKINGIDIDVEGSLDGSGVSFTARLSDGRMARLTVSDEGIVLGEAVDADGHHAMFSPFNLKPIKRPVITAEIFRKKTGHDPIHDDLERCNCDKQGQLGHQDCGWCPTHDKPRFMCGCRGRLFL